MNYEKMKYLIESIDIIDEAFDNNFNFKLLKNESQLKLYAFYTNNKETFYQVEFRLQTDKWNVYFRPVKHLDKNITGDDWFTELLGNTSNSSKIFSTVI